MATISFDQFVKQSGGKPQDAQVLNTTVKPVEQQLSDGFLSSIGKSFQERGQKVQESMNVNAENPSLKNALQGGFNIAGQFAGGALDILGEAGKKIVPEFITKTVNDISQKIADVATNNPKILDGLSAINKGIDSYSEWAKNNPEDAKTLDGIVNIGSLLIGGETKKPNIPEIKTPIKPIINKTGELLKTAGESAYGVSVPMQESTKIALQTYEANQPSFLGRVKNFISGENVGTKPITESKTAAKYGIAGTEWQLGVQAKKISNDVWDNVLKPKLSTATDKIDMKKYFSDLRQEIIKKTPELGRRQDLLEALDAFQEPYKKVGSISPLKLQQYKEGWAKFVPEKTYKGKPIGSAFKDVQNMATNKARNTIYNVVGTDGKEAYFDYGNLKAIQEAGLKSIDQLRSKGFTRQIWEAVLDKAVTPITTFGGKVLYRTGQGLEMYGKSGAKTIGDIIKE